MTDDNIAERFLDWTCDKVFPWIFSAFFVACAIGLLWLAGFGVNWWWVNTTEGPIERGTIVEKHHYAAYTSSMKGMTTFHPESWEMMIYGAHHKSGRRGLRTLGVYEGTFDRFKVGDQISFEPDDTSPPETPTVIHKNGMTD